MSTPIGLLERAQALAARCERPELERRLGRERLVRDAPLAPLTTFRIGGPADLLYDARTADELVAALAAISLPAA